MLQGKIPRKIRSFSGFKQIRVGVGTVFVKLLAITIFYMVIRAA